MPIICIDAGHSEGVNPSPVNKAYVEGNRMWDLKMLLASQLVKYEGIELVFTRTLKKDNPDLTTRGQTAAGCDMFISLHSNAAASEEVTGTEIIVSNSATPEFVELAYKLKEKVNSEMGDPNKRAVYTRDYYSGAVQPYDEIENTDWYGVLRGCQQVKCDNAMIIEHGFHTNYGDTLWLMDDFNLLYLAVEEAQLIADFYGCKRIPLINPPTGVSEK